MKSGLFLVCLCAAPPALFGFGAAPVKGSIEGQVVDSRSGAPVRKITVTLSTTTRGIRLGEVMRPSSPPAMESDDQGRFAFRDLPAGGYQIRAQRQGNNYGAGVNSALQVFLGQGQQLKGVVVKIVAPSAITGKVLDQDGDPVERAQVSLLRRQSVRNGQGWSQVGGAQTSDLGEYRISGIAPGNYLVRASYRDGAGYSLNQALPDKPELTYVDTFYPSTFDTSSATPVVAAIGAEVRGIDIKLRMLATVRVRGTVIDPGAVPNRMPSVWLTPKDSTAGYGVGTLSAAVWGGDGSFEIRGVRPGSYILSAQRSNSGSNIGSDQANLTWGATQFLEIGEKHVDGITLRLAPGRDVQGSFKYDADANPNLRGTMVQLLPAAGTGYYGSLQARMGEGTSFSVKGVLPGIYTVSVSIGSRDSYVKSILYEGQEIPPSGVDVTTGGSLEIHMASDGARVTGKLVDAAGKPLSRGILTIAPVDAAAQPTIAVIQNGEVRSGMIRPGEYRLYAWDSLDYSSAQDPDVLKQAESNARTIKLEPRAVESMSLTAIPASAASGFAGAGTEPHAKGSVEGQVLDAKTGSPLPRVTVRLGDRQFVTSRAVGVGAGVSSASGGSNNGIEVETDAQGRFLIRDADPGAYQLGAVRRGFLTGLYGQRPDMTNDEFIVGEGQQIKGVVLKLKPQGVITGKIVDERGDPMMNVQVQVFRREFSEGAWHYRTTGSVESNDLGEYRVANLPAGSYWVAASPAAPPVIRGPASLPDQPLPPQPEMAYPLTYYPAALEVTQAKPVAVDTGAEVSGIDLAMKKVPTVRVRGKISNPPPEGSRQFSLTLYPKGPDAAETVQRQGRPRYNPDGTFEIAGVRPGSYILMARSTDNAGATRMGMRSLEVGNSNMDGVTLQLAGGRDVQLKVTIDERAAEARMVSARLVPVYPNVPTGFTQQQMNDPQLAFREVFPIPYTVSVTNLPNNCTCYVKAIRFGGQEIPETGAILTGDGPVEVVLGAAAASVEGTVVDKQGNALVAAALVLAPKDGPPSLLKTTFTDAYGEFYFGANPPGEYKVLASEDADAARLRDPDFLKQFDASAKLVKLGGGAREKVQLTAVPAAKR